MNNYWASSTDYILPVKTLIREFLICDKFNDIHWWYLEGGEATYYAFYHSKREPKVFSSSILRIGIQLVYMHNTRMALSMNEFNFDALVLGMLHLER